ncbi:MAG: ATP-binding protein [Sphingomonas sp.]
MSPADSRPRSIAVSIFALVIGAVVVMAAAFFAITFLGPPPRPAPHMMDNIIHVLKTGTSLPQSAMAPPPEPSGARFGPPPKDFGSGKTRRLDMSPPRGLVFSLSLRRPAARRGEQSDIALAQQVAIAIGLPEARIVAYHDERIAFAPGAVVGGFTIGAFDGARWRIVRTEAQPFVSQWQLSMLGAVLGTMLLLAAPAWWLARAISKPLRQLGATAAVARAGAPLGPVPQGGAAEVRDLTRAVSAMHDRLARHAEGRTAMLAAISHDLGTPLSRLAFWIERLPDEARIRANADIDEMRAMIGAALRFARDESGEQADQRIDLGSLLDSLIEDMTMAGAPASLEPGPRVIVRGNPQALRRLFSNLVENAIRYGDAAALRWRIDGHLAEIIVDDSGPGFDAATAERLFEPFVRGDPSRSRETGGTGLGLAIVRSIAEAHGGTVTLGNCDGGGRVCVWLPLVA